MAEEKFYVSHNGQDMGPFAVSEIVEKVGSGELALTDYVYDEQQQDWVLLMENEQVAEALRAKKPKAPPRSPHKEKTNPQPISPAPDLSQQTTSGDKGDDQRAWYVLKGENKYGPFSYLDLVRMLQEKVIFEFDYVWTGAMESWQRIAEIEDFGPERIRQLHNENRAEAADIFFRRRHSRVAFGGSILVHDNKRVWKGKGISISAGGAGILMENALILPGQTLYLHFKPGDGVPPFNALCEVVNKRYENDLRHKDALVHYGVKFTRISPEAQDFLGEFVKEEEKKKTSA